jgi:hypothetical protein
MNVGAIDLEFEPVGNVITTALNLANRTTVNDAEKVLVANGNEKSKKIFITDESMDEFASFILNRWQHIIVIKDKNHTIHGQQFRNNANGWIDNATNLTFQKIKQYNVN